MSDTRVSVLTPAGTGAIATVAVSGPQAWELARQLFRPAKGKLPELPELHRFWFGTLAGGDEVILAVRDTGQPPHPLASLAALSPRGEGKDTERPSSHLSPGGEVGLRSSPGEGACLEIHCHGGRRVVRWVVEQLLASGGREPPVGTHHMPEHGLNRGLTPPARLLSLAPTLRTASILLDQFHGAFEQAVRAILAHLEDSHPEQAAGPLAELARFALVGRHLVEPWKVVIAGPPNVGKSSLMNALAGYQRSVVSEVAGTTRDVVTVPVAFDGWPVELADTAGLRDTAGLEAEGVERAKRFLAEADLIVWMMDVTDSRNTDLPASPGPLVVFNKIDQPAAWDTTSFPEALRVSALTGEGVAGLAAAIARTLVPHAPSPGAAVPFTPQLADAVEAAHAAVSEGRIPDAVRLLRDALDRT